MEIGSLELELACGVERTREERLRWVSGNEYYDGYDEDGGEWRVEEESGRDGAGDGDAEFS